MKRAQKVKQAAQEIIDEGRKPSVSTIVETTAIPESDVHRCLNFLEKNNEIETYTKEIIGRKHRLISIKR